MGWANVSIHAVGPSALIEGSKNSSPLVWDWLTDAVAKAP